MTKKLPVSLMILLLSFSFYNCKQNDLWGILHDKSSRSDPPTSTINPINTSYIEKDKTITLTFNNEIDISSLSITGNIGNAIPSLSSSNKILTLQPDLEWNIGISKTLTVTCNDNYGNSFTGNYIFSIVSNIAYVHASSNSDVSPCSMSMPCQTIQFAIDTLAGAGSTGIVRVSEGVFESNDTLVHMKPGISLTGGFSSSNWEERDASIYKTILRDLRTSMSSALTPAHVIEISNSGITNQTELHGLTIESAAIITNSSGSPMSTGILINNGVSPSLYHLDVIGPTTTVSNTRYIGIEVLGGSNPNITGSRITGGKFDGSDCLAIGILVSDATTNISYCNITAGSTGNNGKSYGISIQNNSAAYMSNILINSSNSQYTTIGIHMANTSGTSKIYQNTINGGFGLVFASGIYLESNTHPEITNNKISTPSGFGIYEAADSGDPSLVQENNIFNCSKGLYYDVDTTPSEKNVICNGNFGTAGCPSAELVINPTYPEPFDNF